VGKGEGTAEIQTNSLFIEVNETHWNLTGLLGLIAIELGNQAFMLFVLNIEEKQRADAFSLFRQQDCGIVHQLNLGNLILKHVLQRTCLPRFLRNHTVCIILSFNRILFYFKCLYFFSLQYLLDCK